MPKADAICGGQPVFDLKIFPVLEAPNAVEHLGHIPLSDLLDRFVIGCPEVQYASYCAIEQLPALRRVYTPTEEHRICYWPTYR